ncbi:hypothetical protein [Hyphomicrobium sp.]|jgi:hypothetical protein|uniref:hypothetical protein n=1 Tax=Hyphomicrobium sp. TaxID=82 RepID=UPI003566C058
MHGYTLQELESFYDLLDGMVTEVAERELKLPVYDMIQRLFEAADRGERDEGRLRRAILRSFVAPDAVQLTSEFSQRYGQSAIQRRDDSKEAA